MHDTSSTARDRPGDHRENQITKLIDNAKAGQWQVESGIDWAIHPSPPNFLTQRFIGRALGALMAGEEATAAACKMLLADSPKSELQTLLEYQAADEDRHAKVYRTYLERVGMPPIIPDGFTEATKQLINWKGPPSGLVFAIHVVLESEALTLQHELSGDIRCPLFHEINRRVTQDEARHVAFGQLVGNSSSTKLTEEERLETVAAIKDVWDACIKALVNDNAVLWRAVKGFSERRWALQVQSLAQLGLIEPVTA
ncbi:MAG: hypothetical protein CMM52_01950 [Rhodospirillaceae bacterium]|nr:hypothetical protein [Rhodospirillaceae bacterium]|tara:strand:- start:29048 stop:29812 length:765 start_codon:yes stop_codon:yes gene_type:complete